MELAKDFIVVIIFIVLLAGICNLNTQVDNLKKQTKALELQIELTARIQDHQTNMLELLILESPQKVTKTKIFEATAYSWTGNRTSTGTWPQPQQTVAVDPDVIPYGSKLTINGVSGYIAEDSGSAVTGNIIDIYMEKEEHCIAWGRQQVTVVID